MVALAGCSDAPPNRLQRPNLVQLDQAGNLLVVDMPSGRVVRFSPDGRFLGAIGRKGLDRGQLWRPWGVCELPDGRIGVINHSLRNINDANSLHREVKVFDRAGNEQLAFPIVAPGMDSLGWPQDLEVVPGGFVVGEQQHNALLIFDFEGGFVRSLHEIEGGPPLVSPGSPQFVDGSIWIAEYRSHRIRRITLEGRQEVSFGSEGDGPGQLLFPQAVSVHPDGWLVVADLGNFRIVRFDLQGRYLDHFAPEPVSPDTRVQLMDVSVGKDGQVYAADSKGGRIVVWKPGVGLVRTISDW